MGCEALSSHENIQTHEKRGGKHSPHVKMLQFHQTSSKINVLENEQGHKGRLVGASGITKNDI